MVIDYFEFTVIVEASWHSGTILRQSIMEKAINVWYNKLSEMEKRRAFEFFNRTKPGHEDRKLEIQQKFLARYNPDNQYIVHTNFEGKKEVNYAFKFNGRYFVNLTTFFSKGHITEIEKKPCN